MTKQLTSGDDVWTTPADGVSDDWPAFQAAANEADGKIQVPHGSYRLTRPVVSNRGSVEFAGDKSSVIVDQPAGFPMFAFMASNYPDCPLTAISTGPAMTLDGSLFYCINLRDSYRGDIDGQAAFCFECFVQFDSFVGGLRDISASWGTRLTGERQHNALYLAVYTESGTSVFWVTLTVNGIERQIKSTIALTSGNIYHAAVSYDGATVRLFVNGALAGSIPAVGTITQSLYEDWTLGANFHRWPHGSSSSPMAIGRVGGVRISNVVRYTAAFTPPTADPAYDNGTALLLDLAHTDGYWIPFKSPEGNGFLLFRFNGTLTPTGGNKLTGFTLSAGHGCAILANNSQNSYYGDITVPVCRHGIELMKDCYHSTLERVYVTGGHFGIALIGNSTLSRVVDCQASYQSVGFVASDSSVVFENCFTYGGSMLAGYLLKGDNCYAALQCCAVGDEGQNHPPEAGILAGDLTNLLMQSGGPTIYVWPCPNVILRNCQNTLFQGVQFGVNPGVPVVIQQAVPGTVELQGCSQVGTGVPRPWLSTLAG